MVYYARNEKENTEMLADLNKTTAAREWLDANAKRWRLQTMQSRGRYSLKDGIYRRLPVRVRRFLNGTPVGYIHEVMELLRTTAPYSEPVFNLEDGHDARYWPTSTAIVKDSPENTTNGKDATYTIVQDLRMCDDSSDSLGTTDESRCSSVSTSEYYWGEADVESCPGAEQGVVWQVAGVSRDEETGTFSYVMRKQQALTQHVGPVVTECDRGKTVTVETWDNLYGEPGSFRQDPVNGGSAPVDLPPPCGQADGVTVELSVQANPDCTYKAVVQIATAAADKENAFSIYRDQYKVQETVRDLNQAAPLGRRGVEYAGGVTTKYSSERNPDGTYTNSVETEAEREVRSSTVERRVTPRSVVVTRVDTNVAEPATALTGTYGSFKSTKTPGGLYVNEYVEYDRTVVDRLGLSCADTKFLHTHETTGMVAEFGKDHVEEAGGGVVRSKSYELQEDGGIVERTQTKTEHAVEDASVERRITRRGVFTRKTSRSVADGPSVVYGVRTRGSSASYVTTDGGLYDVTTETFSRTTGDVLATSCTDTAFLHTHSSSKTAASLSDGHVKAASGGVVTAVSYSEDDQGVVTEETRTTSEHTVVNAVVSRRIGYLFDTDTRQHRSVDAARKDSELSSAKAVGSEVEAALTDGNMWNVRVTTLDLSKAAGKTLSTSCARTVFQHVDETRSTVKSAGDSHVERAGGGVHRRTTFSTDPSTGVVTKDVAVTTETPVANAVRTVQTTLYGTRTTVLDRNVGTYDLDPGERPGDSTSVTMNDGGSYNVETVRGTFTGKATGRQCQKDRYHHVTVTSKARGEMGDAHAKGGSGGVRGETRSSLTGEGAFVVDDQTYQELPVPQSRVSVRVTRTGKTRTTTDTQVSSPGTEPGADEAGRSWEREVTPGGLYNVTTSEFTPATGKIGQECRSDLFSHDTTTVTAASGVDNAHVDTFTKAGSGFTSQRQWTRDDSGAWTKTDFKHEEVECQEGAVDEYEDAFGSRTAQRVQFGTSDKVSEGKKYTKEKKISYVTRQRTPGGRWTVTETLETPTPVDSGWVETERRNYVGGFENRTSYVVQRAFRNQTLSWLKSLANEMKSYPSYSGGDGIFESSPSLSFSANKFGLYDGTAGVHTTYTARAASGGSIPDKNWHTNVDYESVSYLPSSENPGQLVKVTTVETHAVGGGNGHDNLEKVLTGTVMKGSSWSYHPAGDTFSYDIITNISVNRTLVDESGEETT